MPCAGGVLLVPKKGRVLDGPGRREKGGISLIRERKEGVGNLPESKRYSENREELGKGVTLRALTSCDEVKNG